MIIGLIHRKALPDDDSIVLPRPGPVYVYEAGRDVAEEVDQFSCRLGLA